MADVTQILSKIDAGDKFASAELLPLVYDELRQLAAQRMRQERPDHTLQATALVHEAFVRLVDRKRAQDWESRGHFFSAAAEAMRRILVDRARQHGALRRGGDLRRINIDAADLVDQVTPDQLLSVDEALQELSRNAPEVAEIVKLRYFAGLSIEQASRALQISTSTGYRHWTYARAWLHSTLLNSDV
jgi:RNA polymerase sigma factor (TIGR02999 family)